MALEKGVKIFFDEGIEGIEEGITKGTDPAIALLPADPAQLLARDNLAVVDCAARGRLLRAYRAGACPRTRRRWSSCHKLRELWVREGLRGRGCDVL